MERFCVSKVRADEHCRRAAGADIIKPPQQKSARDDQSETVLHQRFVSPRLSTDKVRRIITACPRRISAPKKVHRRVKVFEQKSYDRHDIEQEPKRTPRHLVRIDGVTLGVRCVMGHLPNNPPAALASRHPPLLPGHPCATAPPHRKLASRNEAVQSFSRHTGGPSLSPSAADRLLKVVPRGWQIARYTARDSSPLRLYWLCADGIACASMARYRARSLAPLPAAMSRIAPRVDLWVRARRNVDARRQVAEIAIQA